MSSLWHMTVSGTVLIAAAVCVRSLFLDRLGKALFPALWLVAAVRLLTPVSVPGLAQIVPSRHVQVKKNRKRTLHIS